MEIVKANLSKYSLYIYFVDIGGPVRGQSLFFQGDAQIASWCLLGLNFIIKSPMVTVQLRWNLCKNKDNVLNIVIFSHIYAILQSKM